MARLVRDEDSEEHGEDLDLGGQDTYIHNMYVYIYIYIYMYL